MPSPTTSGVPLALLAILDGWGLRAEREANAVALARTPVMERLARTCPMTTLDPHGEAVGLPPGQMGNSEVGHLNIGAGRVVYQDIMRINRAIASGEFFENKTVRELIASVSGKGGGGREGATLHLVGLVSDGGVHSHIEHLFALLELCRREGVRRVAVHVLADGRDTSPTSGREFVARLAERIALTPGAHIATICGRYYAMDRDKRWERTKKGWAAMVLSEGAAARDPVAAIEASYAAGKTDEFIEPIVLRDDSGAPVARVQDGDAVFIFNFRADRVRQIARALYDLSFDGFERRAFPKLRIATMTQYSAEFPFPVAFPEHRMENVLGQVFGDRGVANLRIAETEKYAHVTYFFNGGEEKAFPGEERILVPSPKVATYDLQPEMSANEVTERLVREIEARRFRAVILNYANPDMVGHTGILEAAIKAVETVDTCLGRVLAAVASVGGAAIVTADHGNCETMVDPVTGGPHTAHTTNPVPCLLVGTRRSEPLRTGGSLCDLAPTMLEMLGLPQPPEMTGRSLLARANDSGARDAS